MWMGKEVQVHSEKLNLADDARKLFWTQLVMKSTWMIDWCSQFLSLWCWYLSLVNKMMTSSLQYGFDTTCPMWRRNLKMFQVIMVMEKVYQPLFVDHLPLSGQFCEQWLMYPKDQFLMGTNFFHVIVLICSHYKMVRMRYNHKSFLCHYVGINCMCNNFELGNLSCVIFHVGIHSNLVGKS